MDKIVDRSFKTKLISNKNTSFKPSLQKIDDSITIKIDFNSNSIDTSTIIPPDKVETKADVNNQPTNIYYNEVIFYDGGGAKGYGYEE